LISIIERQNKSNGVDINIVDLIFEIGLQKRVKRSGWWVAGVKDPETIAEHSQRAAFLAYIIAKYEGADALKASMMCMIHDFSEVRINDGHKIVSKYLNLEEAEKKAFNDQTMLLPNRIGNELRDLFAEFCQGKTKEAITAKDADTLECALQAIEYYEEGYSSTKIWINSSRKKLKTSTAKQILKIAMKIGSKSWIQKLNK
jgi:putative hydrolases of HD superfamily